MSHFSYIPGFFENRLFRFQGVSLQGAVTVTPILGFAKSEKKAKKPGF